MSEPTSESVDKQIDAFLDRYAAFSDRVNKRWYGHIPHRNKIALFAIYTTQLE